MIAPCLSTSLGLPRQTLQVGLGLRAVLLCAVASVYVVDLSSPGESRLRSAGVALLLGVPLFAVWVAARTHRRWLRVLGVAAAVLTPFMAAITVWQFRPARDDQQVGPWTGPWVSALDAGLWLVILFATIVELRGAPQESDGKAPGWVSAAAIGASLTLVVVVALRADSLGVSWMIRVNSDITDTAPAAQGGHPPFPEPSCGSASCPRGSTPSPPGVGWPCRCPATRPAARGC